jgi:hypothetical protein
MPGHEVTSSTMIWLAVRGSLIHGTLGPGGPRFHRQLVVGPAARSGYQRLANRLEMKVVLRILRGERVNVRRALRRPNKIMRRVYRNGRRAVRNFKAVGLTSPVGAVSAT